MKKQRIESEAEAALVHVKQLGADQAAVTVSSGKGFSVKAQNRSIETVAHYEDQAFSITVFVKKYAGRVDEKKFLNKSTVFIAKFHI